MRAISYFIQNKIAAIQFFAGGRLIIQSQAFSMWQFQLSLSSIVISSDFVVPACFTRVSFIKIEGEAAMVFSLWPDPISINSVLVIFRVSLLAFNQVYTFNRSLLRHDSMLPTLLSAYVICVSSIGVGCFSTFSAILSSLNSQHTFQYWISCW